MSAETVLTIMAMAIATYATRIGGVLLGAYLPRTGWVKQALDALPAAVLTALIAPAVTAGTPEMMAGGITVLAALRLPMVAAIGIGIASAALLRGVL
jgi:uncharacterized membrane protein